MFNVPSRTTSEDAGCLFASGPGGVAVADRAGLGLLGFFISKCWSLHFPLLPCAEQRIHFFYSVLGIMRLFDIRSQGAFIGSSRDRSMLPRKVYRRLEVFQFTITRSATPDQQAVSAVSLQVSLIHSFSFVFLVLLPLINLPLVQVCCLHRQLREPHPKLHSHLLVTEATERVFDLHLLKLHCLKIRVFLHQALGNYLDKLYAMGTNRYGCLLIKLDNDEEEKKERDKTRREKCSPGDCYGTQAKALSFELHHVRPFVVHFEQLTMVDQKPNERARKLSSHNAYIVHNAHLEVGSNACI